MNSFLLWIGGLMVAVLGLLFAAPLVIDWNSYRGVMEEEASRILGRDVRVGGSVNLRLLPSPYVRFEKVRISDAGAALGEPFFRAEAFTLWLAPTPLLRGAIEATELELDRPVLRLAVDAEGRGNWQAVRITPGSVPFAPSDVVLQQVRIRQGSVSLKTPGTSEPIALSGIEGEIAASSLDGPYRFRGTIDWHGMPRELRVGTAQREADGKLRYKASVRSVDSSTSYAFDGILSELSAKARNTGTMTAKLPLANLMPTPSGNRGRGARGNEAVDLTASFDGDLDGVKLDNIAFSFEHEGKPQLMSGIAAANWRNGLRTEMRLASRWLDLDQLAGLPAAGAGPEVLRPPPIDLLRHLIGHVSEVLPRDGSSLLTMDIDQVNLGGAPVGNARLALARVDGLTSIGELKATFPGNTRGELRGTIRPSAVSAPQTTAANAAPRATGTTTGPANVLDGELILRGGSYQRFGNWAGAGAMLPSGPGTDSPFSLSTKLVLAPESVTLTNASLELAGKPATGGIDWNWGKQRKLSIEAEGRAIDIGAFAPGFLDLTLAGSSAAANAPRAFGVPVIAVLAERVAAINRGVGDVRLLLRASELSDGLTSVRDVDAEFEIGQDRLSITRLGIGDKSAARVEIEGALGSLSSRPEGTLRAWITTQTANGLAGLTRILPEGGRNVAQRWLQGGAKLDAALTLQVGAKPDERLSLGVIGVLDGNRHDVSLVLDGGPARWRDAPVALSLKIEGPTTASLAHRMAFTETAAPSDKRGSQRAAHAGTLAIDAAGANARAIVASWRLDLADLGHASYRGTASITPAGGIDTSGDVTVSASNAADLTAFLIGGAKPVIAAERVNGDIAVKRAGNKTTFATDNFAVGDTRMRGTAEIVRRGERTRIEAQVAASEIDIPALIALTTDGATARETASPVAAGDAPSVWADAPFALGRFDELEGQVTLTAPVARLGNGIELEAAEARFGLTPGRIEIENLSGAALGGRFSTRGTIERAQAGASVALEVRLTGGLLERLAGGEAPRAGGTVNVAASASGRSLTPRAVIGALNGKGEIELRGARVSGLSAGLVERSAQAALDAALGAGGEIGRERLEAIVSAERARGELALGNRKIPIEIADGIARLGAIDITTDEAQLRNTTTVDLTALSADSEWRITPRRPWSSRPGAKRREPLPVVTLVWTGAISGIAKQLPRLSLDGLERDLGLRRIENEAEKLEEIRRQDEERIRIEQQRSQEQGTQPPSPAPTTAPVIEAPFQIQRSVESDGATAPPATTPAPLPRVVRPPPPRPAQPTNQRTLQDILNGQ